MIYLAFWSNILWGELLGFLGIPTIERCLWENNALRNGFWYVVDVSNTVEIQPFWVPWQEHITGDVISVFCWQFCSTSWAKHNKFFLWFPRLLQFPLQSPKCHAITPCLSYSLPSSTHHRRPYPCPPKKTVRVAKQPLTGVWEFVRSKLGDMIFLTDPLEDQKMSIDLYYWRGISRLVGSVMCRDMSTVTKDFHVWVQHMDGFGDTFGRLPTGENTSNQISKDYQLLYLKRLLRMIFLWGARCKMLLERSVNPFCTKGVESVILKFYVLSQGLTSTERCNNWRKDLLKPPSKNAGISSKIHLGLHKQSHNWKNYCTWK